MLGQLGPDHGLDHAASQLRQPGPPGPVICSGSRPSSAFSSCSPGNRSPRRSVTSAGRLCVNDVPEESLSIDSVFWRAPQLTQLAVLDNRS
jgi:hypothetical protein